VNALMKIRNQLLADKRKLGLMCTLCLVALLLWGRLLMKNVPRTAVADPNEAIAAAAGQSSTTPIITPDKPKRSAVVVANYATVDRDLFAFKPIHYGIKESEQNSDKPLAKLADQKADEIEDQHQARLTVQAAARQLRLQSTLLGNVNRAMINGVLLEPGQTILGFELVEVKSRRVTLVLDGIEVTLEM